MEMSWGVYSLWTVIHQIAFSLKRPQLDSNVSVGAYGGIAPGIVGIVCSTVRSRGNCVGSSNKQIGELT